MKTSCRSVNNLHSCVYQYNRLDSFKQKNNKIIFIWVNFYVSLALVSILNCTFNIRKHFFSYVQNHAIIHWQLQKQGPLNEQTFSMGPIREARKNILSTVDKSRVKATTRHRFYGKLISQQVNRFLIFPTRFLSQKTGNVWNKELVGMSDQLHVILI